MITLSLHPQILSQQINGTQYILIMMVEVHYRQIVIAVDLGSKILISQTETQQI